MDPICWDISDRARTAWRKTAVPRGSQFFNIFGTGFETAYDVEYGSLEAPIVDPSDITNGDPVRRFTWIDGDSTVPLCCAVSGAHCEFTICMHSLRLKEVLSLCTVTYHASAISSWATAAEMAHIVQDYTRL